MIWKGPSYFKIEPPNLVDSDFKSITSEQIVKIASYVTVVYDGDTYHTNFIIEKNSSNYTLCRVRNTRNHVFLRAWSPYIRHNVRIIHYEIRDKHDVKKKKKFQNFEVAFGNLTLEVWMREDDWRTWNRLRPRAT